MIGAWRGPSRFRYHRLVDLAASVLSSPITAPVVLIAALVVRTTSQGPGFFRQERIGRNGEPFRIWKLRTMVTSSADTASDDWSSVTAGADRRVTPVGHKLRRWKVDELPQLLNVARGDMSLVGPRPDVAGFADQLVGDDALLTTIRPGITGPATLLFRNEQSFLGEVDDPTGFSDNVLYPAKVAVNLAWIEHGSLLDDLKLVLFTVGLADETKLRSMVQQWAPELFESGPVVDVMAAVGS